MEEVQRLWDIERSVLDVLLYRYKNQHRRSDFFRHFQLVCRALRRTNAPFLCSFAGSRSSHEDAAALRCCVGVRLLMATLVRASAPVFAQLRHTYHMPICLSLLSSYSRLYYICKVRFVRSYVWVWTLLRLLPGACDDTQTHHLACSPTPPSSRRYVYTWTVCSRTGYSCARPRERRLLPPPLRPPPQPLPPRRCSSMTFCRTCSGPARTCCTCVRWSVCPSARPSSPPTSLPRGR